MQAWRYGTFYELLGIGIKLNFIVKIVADVKLYILARRYF